ncbi:hypothetical protein [Megasphaera stantonii]|uniref:Uncharacterized protein n=1 Tax=Megasphaera stantonii TaxID=2144175 RepID=A0A346B154_9FIRM|nr:hypothetical protein [Megasphaera stantonii]AXL21847.1 hypothetical protein DKB62_09875 [Megasphaera stantonii]
MKIKGYQLIELRERWGQTNIIPVMRTNTYLRAVASLRLYQKLNPDAKFRIEAVPDTSREDTPTQWIKTRDRLPELKHAGGPQGYYHYSDSVLVWYRGVMKVTTIMKWDAETKYSWDLDDDTIKDVYDVPYWAPISEPIQEDA